jgi:hypothetical protein
MNESTRQLAEALQRMHALYPSMRFGQLVCFAVELCRDERNYGIYDVEDADLLKAIDKHLQQRSSSSIASSEPERKAG